MFIVYGTRVTRRRRGRVAEHCLFCDQARPFHLHELREYTHLYYIPVWRSKPAGWELTCQSCKERLFTDTHDYAGIVKDRRADLETLVARTNPDLPERIGEWLAMRDRVIDGEAAKHERLEVIATPFLACGYAVHQRSQNLHVDWWSAWWLVCTVVAGCAFFYALATQPINVSLSPWAMVWGIAAVVSLILLLVSFATDARRFARRKYSQFILQSLEPLNLSYEELERVLQGLKAEEYAIGKAFKAEKLYAQLTNRRTQREAAGPIRQTVPPREG